MKLSETLIKQNIIYPLKSKNKSDAIQELLNCLLEQNVLTATTKLYSFIDEHDKLMNPAVGRGTAYHYSTSMEIQKPVASFGISINGIDYDSPDKQNVHFIFLILDSVQDPIEHRKLINRFQHFINDLSVKSQLLTSDSSSSIMDIIINWENNLMQDFK